MTPIIDATKVADEHVIKSGLNPKARTSINTIIKFSFEVNKFSSLSIIMCRVRRQLSVVFFFLVY